MTRQGDWENVNCCHFWSEMPRVSSASNCTPEQRCCCRKLAVPLCTEYASVDCMNTKKTSGRLRNTFAADRANLLRWLFNKPISILDLQLMHKTYLYIMIMSLYADDVIGLFFRK